MLISTDKARICIDKIQDYYKDDPNGDEARVFLAGLRITKESIYNPESFRRLLIQNQERLSGTDFQDISHEVNPDFELIDQLIDKNIRITDNDQLVGALLDFPPQSTENFKIWTSAENKLDQYLERGKQGMIDDGWTDEEVEIMTHISIPRDIIAEKQILTRHQDQIGLSEDEIEVSLHDKRASDLGIFGYETLLFPKPENKFKDEEIKWIEYKTKEAELITGALTKIAKIKSRLPVALNSRSISNIEDAWRRGNNV